VNTSIIEEVDIDEPGAMTVLNDRRWRQLRSGRGQLVGVIVERRARSVVPAARTNMAEDDAQEHDILAGSPNDGRFLPQH